MLKVIDMFGRGPFRGGSGADLHQAQFTGPPAHVGMEIAFAPDDGSNERSVNLITLGSFNTSGIKPMFAPIVPAFESQKGCQKQEQHISPTLHGW